jgi:hypothetical protein
VAKSVNGFFERLGIAESVLGEELGKGLGDRLWIAHVEQVIKST